MYKNISPKICTPYNMCYTLLFSIPASLVILVHWKERKKGRREGTGDSPLNCPQAHHGSWPAVWKYHMDHWWSSVCQHLEFTSLTTYPITCKQVAQEQNGRTYWKQQLEDNILKGWPSVSQDVVCALNQLSLPRSEDTGPGIKV